MVLGKLVLYRDNLGKFTFFYAIYFIDEGLKVEPIYSYL